MSGNIFAYCKNNPVNLSDLSGQFGIALPLAWGAISSALEVLGTTIAAVVSSPVVITVAIVATAGFLAYAGYQYYESRQSTPIYNSDSSANDSPHSGESTKAKTKKPPTKIGPYDDGAIVVDPSGNAIPLKEGETLEGSPDGKMVQVKDKSGNPTGVRFDGLGHKNQPDLKARVPHAHRVDEFGNKLLDGSGNPHLPARIPTW